MIDPYRFTGPRQAGESWSARHDRMLAALPTDGGTIIVITNEIGRILRRALRSTRGFSVSRRWKFIGVRYLSDCTKLEGLRGNVVVDWSIVEHAHQVTRDRIRGLVAEIVATHV